MSTLGLDGRSHPSVLLLLAVERDHGWAGKFQHFSSQLVQVCGGRGCNEKSQAARINLGSNSKTSIFCLVV